MKLSGVTGFLFYMRKFYLNKLKQKGY